MKNRFCLRALLVMTFVCFPCTAQSLFSQVGDPVNGKKLFERDWTSFFAKHSTPADGIGPLFNDVSCVACHNQGGVGGGGPVSKNAQLLSILPSRDRNGNFDLREDSLKRMFDEGKKIHQNLGSSNGIVLHRFSVIDGYQDWRDQLVWGGSDTRGAKQRNLLLDHTPIHRISRRVPASRDQSGRRLGKSEITIQISQRNTPSLFGAGLIESIPEDEIRSIAFVQRRLESDGINGKVARLPNDSVGKFGWRGQKSSLAEFTVQACAVELGLGTFDQSQDPLPSSLNVPDDLALTVGNDMSLQEVADVVEFIRDLPPPAEKLPSDEKQLKLVKRGEAVFTRLNCATCHVKKVGDVDGVYSDFLMHDMGAELADVSGVISSRTTTQIQGPSLSIGGYFGPATSVASSSKQVFTVGEDKFWQTPPLWGIADSAPYMHDGRARDLHEAIMLHGGEADESRKAYERLPKKYRRYLHEYLNTLGAVK